MAERVNIGDQVFGICNALDIDPHRVSELVIKPSEVVATIYCVDQHGAKYVDIASGCAAVDVRTFQISTSPSL